MESQTTQQSSQYLSLATWALKLGLTEEEVTEITQNHSLPSLDEKDEVLYEGALSYSNKHAVSFYLCCSHALSLYLQENITKQDVENHLSKKLAQVSQYFPEQELPKNYKTILLLGRSGEGKSLLTNNIVGKEVAKIGTGSKSLTLDAKPYISEKYHLNVVDTEGFDGTSQKISNQELMEKLLMKIVYCLDLGASIDAIIIVWCPIRNGRSGLEKTMEIVKETFGEEALKSCIFMIQGNWKAAIDVCDLGEAVPEEKEALQKDFPDVPLIEYDARSSAEKQFPDLQAAIDKVQPYKKKYFEKKRKEEFFNMVRVFKIKMQKELEQNHSNESKEEAKKSFISAVESIAVKLASNREELLERIKLIWNQIFTAENAKLALKATTEILITGLVLTLRELAKRPL